ncbi:unnamed protein product [Sphagnum jensenii]|uniref:Uncharacterized protein n=1 Tax=Sphagnum jensenii TaxID=128206 RepID=A0ABP1AC97_9BRYO
MLGGMVEDPEVGDPPLAKLVGLDFGLPSSEDTLAMSVFEKNQNIIEPKTLCDCCLGVYFLTRDGSRCSSCSAFTKDTCDAIAWNLKDLIPATECDLFKFATAADLIQWEVYSDAENGGMTTASFQSNGDLGTGKLFCTFSHPFQ